MQILELTPEQQLFPLGQTRLRDFADPITLGIAASCISAWLSVGPAAAAPPPLLVPGEIEALQPNPAEGGAGEGPFGFLTGISKSGNLLGDMWGLRPLLGKYGISLAVSETSEVLGNVTGGLHQGFEYDGLTQMAVQLDTQQAFGWYGGTFRASALQIHGRNLSADNLLTLQTASGIEADPGARLWELWYQQKFLEEDRADVKIGQMSLDQEFIVSQNALVFVNTMFGWPLVPSDDLPGGGPAYPLSALGVRLRARPTDSLTALLAVTNGNPRAQQSGRSAGAKSVRDQLSPEWRRAGNRRAAILISGTRRDGHIRTAGRYSRAPSRLGSGTTAKNFDDLQFDDRGCRWPIR